MDDLLDELNKEIQILDGSYLYNDFVQYGKSQKVKCLPQFPEASAEANIKKVKQQSTES